MKIFVVKWDWLGRSRALKDGTGHVLRTLYTGEAMAIVEEGKEKVERVAPERRNLGNQKKDQTNGSMDDSERKATQCEEKKKEPQPARGLERG